jgi:hypothetical protein
MRIYVWLLAVVDVHLSMCNVNSFIFMLLFAGPVHITVLLGLSWDALDLVHLDHDCMA